MTFAQSTLTFTSRHSRPTLVSEHADETGARYDLAETGWTADYPDPSSMLWSILEDKTVLPTFDNASYRRRLNAVGQLTGPRRYLAYGKLAVDLARNAAPIVAWGDAAPPEFFSARIGCQIYGVYGWTSLPYASDTPPTESITGPFTGRVLVALGRRAGLGSRRLANPRSVSVNQRRRRTASARPCTSIFAGGAKGCDDEYRSRSLGGPTTSVCLEPLDHSACISPSGLAGVAW